jgi:copper(I)-binding protein
MNNSWLRAGRIVCLGILGWTCALAADGAGLAMESAWVRAMPPGMQMTAGFGRLHNPGTQAIELVAFSSPDFNEVGLHRTETVDGVSRMREVPSLVIAGGEAVELAPGGYHLMLMGPNQPLREGQAVAVRVTTADGRVFRFELPVERR